MVRVYESYTNCILTNLNFINCLLSYYNYFKFVIEMSCVHLHKQRWEKLELSVLDQHLHKQDYSYYCDLFVLKKNLNFFFMTKITQQIPIIPINNPNINVEVTSD